MANISVEQAAGELLACCLNGRPWRGEHLDRLVQPDGNQALFRIVVERLGDLFEPRLCDVYAQLFSQVVARVIPSVHPKQLLDRYQRIRRPRRFDRDPAAIRDVFVLSRVTLGADVAITSLFLDAAKRLFPNARIHFAGPMKSWELFAADPRLQHLPVNYGRSASLQSRLASWPELREALRVPGSLVLDPDSRLTQLGLLPVCEDQDYFFFESRSYGGHSDAALPDLTRRWLGETFDLHDANPYIAPVQSEGSPVNITVSFGVGENQDKRVADPFEADLLRWLAKRESSVLIDRGVGGEEAERVEHAVAQSGGSIRMWDGSFAGFASHIARSQLYIGYDSAGGHVAAARGVPLISIFGGFASERMFQRWRPVGRGPILVIAAGEPASTFAAVTSSPL